MGEGTDPCSSKKGLPRPHECLPLSHHSEGFLLTHTFPPTEPGDAAQPRRTVARTITRASPASSFDSLHTSLLSSPPERSYMVISCTVLFLQPPPHALCHYSGVLHRQQEHQDPPLLQREERTGLLPLASSERGQPRRSPAGQATRKPSGNICL